MRARKLTLTGLLLIGALGVGVSPALAGTGHGFSASFGPGGIGKGTFTDVQGVAVDQSTGNPTSGDVYVYEAGTGSIDKFNAAGEPADFSGLAGNEITGVGAGFNEFDAIAVDSSAGPAKGDIYVTHLSNGGAVFIYGADGVKLGELTGLGEYTCGLAVGPSGALYVSTYESVLRYTPTANPVTNADFESSLNNTHPACNIGVDAEGDVYTVGSVTKYPASQFGQPSALGTAIDGTGASLAVDEAASGDVYVDQGPDVADYNASGALLSTFGELGSNALVNSFGIALDEPTNTLYVGEESAVKIFTPGSITGVPSTEPASEVTATTAKLNGKLNPAGKKTEFYYDYNKGASCMGGSKTPVEEGEGAVATTVSGLEPSEEYSFCLRETDAFGSTLGSRQGFMTAASAPVVESVSSSGVTPFAAKLEAVVDPEKQPTTCEFEYVDEASFLLTEYANATSKACPATLEGAVGKPTSVEVTGLQPSTTYHYRIVATNNTGTSKPTEGTGEFTTPEALPPTVETVYAENVGQTTATLIAEEINPNFQETTCEFQYVEYGIWEKTAFAQDVTSVPCPHSLGSGGSEVSTSVNVDGLAEGTEYELRILVTNPTGTSSRARHFTTRPPPPAVTTGASSQVVQAAAAVTGTVDPEGLTSRYYYQYGLSTAYGAQTEAVLGLTGTTPVAAPAELIDLAPGTTYHYRLVAESEDGAHYGADQSFTTPSYTPPSVATGGVSAVSANAATISGTVNPEGIQTTYEFQVGTTTSYGAEVFGNAKEVSEPESVSLGLENLQPGTTYHYRLLATNEAGTSYGADQSFTTPGVGGSASQLVAPATPPLLATPAIAFPTTTATTTKTLTNAQKLANALKSCKKDKKKSKRTTCMRQAKKRYAPAKKTKKKSGKK